jgi:hypothetical protein
MVISLSGARRVPRQQGRQKSRRSYIAEVLDEEEKQLESEPELSQDTSLVRVTILSGNFYGNAIHNCSSAKSSYHYFQVLAHYFCGGGATSLIRRRCACEYRHKACFNNWLQPPVRDGPHDDDPGTAAP